LRKPALDSKDFEILSLIALEPKAPISSWEICQKLFSHETNPQNHLSSVIWRLEKLTKAHFLKQLPHPTRNGKAVYSLSQPDLSFSVDGTVFIYSKVGCVIVNCRFVDGCGPKCQFGGSKCKLSNLIRKEGLEVVLEIAKVLAKKNGIKEKEEEEKICPVKPQ
jgi:hypothetical protein